MTLHPAYAAVRGAHELLAGAPLTRYQLEAATVIGRPADTGPARYYTTVCILWPRQTGKTTLLAALALGRAMVEWDHRGAYAAQTGHITSQRFKEWTDLLTRSPGGTQRWDLYRSEGKERFTHLRQHGYMRAFPPIPGRLRSAALDLVIVDEAQEHDDVKVGAPLDADIVPTMDTRPRAQWIIAGTAGDARATYWRRHYELAKQGTPGRLLIEIGTPPEDADTDDPRTWQRWHPGLRAGRTTLAKLHDARETLGPERFAQEYCNRWGSHTVVSLFPMGAWGRAHQPAAGITGPVSLAFEVPPDRESAVIVAAGQSTAHPETIHVELVAELPLAQAVPAAAELAKEHRAPIWIDATSPGVHHADLLARARVPVHKVTTAELLESAAALYDRVADRRLSHLDQPPLTAAALQAQRKKLGNRWTFDRYAPGGATLTAAGLAALAAHRGTARDTPSILH